jgi:hypothetical protein
MNFKPVIVLFILVIGGTWYGLVGGKQINESHVRQLYSDYFSALDKRDGKAVCDLFSEKISGKFKSTSPSMPVKEEITKANVCASVEELYETKEKLEKASGEEFFFNFDYTIKS